MFFASINMILFMSFFSRNEKLLSSIEDTVLMTDVIGKCVVLSWKDYFACRPTEVPEADVYMYESRYSPNDKDRSIKKLKSSKRFTPSLKVTFL